MVIAAVRTPAWERSHEQRMEALERANKVRSLRAQVKRDLSRGRILITDLLADPPDCIATAKVLDILLALRGVGLVKARRILREIRISETKTVGGMSDRQRHDLAARLA